jgi:hypothetical protein
MGKTISDTFGKDAVRNEGARAAGARTDRTPLAITDVQDMAFDPADAGAGTVTFIDNTTLFFSAMDDGLRSDNNDAAVPPGDIPGVTDARPGGSDVKVSREVRMADDPLLSGTGVMTFPDGSSLTYRDVEHVVLPCFTAGTMVQTDRGEIAVEALVPGNRVLTRDRGYQTIIWVGRRSLAAAELPHLAPVRIARGALGPGMPTRDMDVSPQLRLLVQGPRTKLLFGEIEVLVPALHLVGYPGISRLEGPRADYIHIMCARHEVIWCDGIWTESFQPNDETLAGLDDAQRGALEKVLPGLRHGQGTIPAARRTLQRHEADLLMS